MAVPVSLDRERILIFDHKATFLLMQRYGLRPYVALYETVPVPGQPKQHTVRIRDIDALAYFLWVGLQRDAQDAGETLTLEQAQAFISPMTLEAIFNAMLPAISSPFQRKNGEPASAAGAPAGEDEPAKTKSTTGLKRSASPAAAYD